MAKPRLKSDEAPQEQQSATDQQATTEHDSAGEQQPSAETRPDEKLKFAREKLSRMEETQKVCYRHQNDLPTLAEKLKEMGYKEYEITQLLEPKGPRSIPGYMRSEIERQKQYVNFLSARVKPAESHTAGLEQGQSEDSTPPRY